MKEVIKYSNCFVCGDKNPHGLQAKFHFDGKAAECWITADERFEGYKGIFHGGIISSLLDEVMIKAILAQDVYTVTAELTVKYVAPVQIGDKLRFTGRVVRSRGRLYFAESSVVNQDGREVATASAKYIEADDTLRSRLMNSVE